MARHMTSRKSGKWAVLLGIGALACLLLVAVVLRPRAGASDAPQPLGEVLRQEGFKGELGDWLDTLPEEQRTLVDMAYEASVADGYEGEEEAWAAEQVQARREEDGSITVILPDGGEFVVEDAGKGGSAPAKDEASPAKDKSAASDETPSDNKASKSDDKNDGKKNDECASGDGDSDESASDKSDESASSDCNTSGDGSDDESQQTESKDKKVSPTIVVDRVVVHKGDEKVSVPVSIRSNPGLLGLTFSVSYDESALKLTSAKNGKAFDGVLSMTKSKGLASGCQFTWDGIELGEGDVRDGVILTLQFDVLTKEPGLYSVAVRSGGPAFDGDLGEVQLVVEDGGVVVE